MSHDQSKVPPDQVGKAIDIFTKYPNLKRCFFPPSGKCALLAIKAHTISSALILRPMSDQGKLIEVRRELAKSDYSIPRVEANYHRIGISNATTFTGLCHKHDSRFESLDNTIPTEEDKQLLFLLLFRNVIRSHWRETAKLQAFEALINNVDMLSKTTAFERELYTAQAYRVLLERFFRVYVGRRWDELTHTVIYLKNTPASIAANPVGFMVFDPEDIVGSSTPLFFNIFPHKQTIIIIISCFTSDIFLLKPSFPYLFAYKPTTQQRQFISNLVLLNCDNFIISPRYYENMIDAKRKWILNTLRRNVKNPTMVKGTIFPMENLLSDGWDLF